MKPPCGDNISEDITDMSNYFGTSDGAEDLFEVTFKLFKKAKELNAPILIENM